MQYVSSLKDHQALKCFKSRTVVPDDGS